MKFTSGAGLTLHLDHAAHRLHNALCDRHPKTGSLNLRYLGRRLPRKRLKNLFAEFRRHSDAGILHPEMAAHICLSRRGILLRQIDIDSSVFRRKFNRVGEQINQNLIQPDTVTVHVLRLDLLNKNIKMLVFLPNLRLHDIHNTVHRLAQGDLIHIQGQLAALDL